MHVVMLDGAYKGEVREVRYSAAKELIDAGRAKPYSFDPPTFVVNVVGTTTAADFAAGYRVTTAKPTKRKR
jgi:hypothetical protein